MTARILRPYQAQAVDFLKRVPTAALFIDMGLGKTAATLHAILSFPRPILLVGPIRVIETVWEGEAQKWPATKDLKFSLVRGSPAARRRALEADADIYLVNPELLEEALLARSYEALVIDESSLFKNPSTKRFKTLRKHLPKFARRVLLTGTPSPNSLMDLWSQIFILDRGERLETAFYRFKSRYFEQVDYQGFKFEPRAGSKEIITSLISDIVFRVEAKGNLPEREVIPNPIEVHLPPDARKLYDKMARDAFMRLCEKTSITAANAAAAMMKLRQIASGFVYNDDQDTVAVHREKVEALRSVIEETGSPVIVVYHFQHELKALRKAFPSGIGLNDPEWTQDKWDAGKIPLLFLHPASGGHGLNLQYGSHTMAIFSPSFSFEQMAQTMARIDRQGQENPVVFHLIKAADTVDELIYEVLDQKEATQSKVLQMVKDYADARKR